MNDVLTLHALVIAGIATPGAILLAFARGYSTSSSQASTQRLASRLGWMVLAGAASYALAMTLLTVRASGPGGLGSQGNPLAAVVMLGYVFVIAPLAWLALGGVGIAWWAARRR